MFFGSKKKKKKKKKKNQGAVVAEGTYQALQETGLDFTNLLATNETEEPHDPLIEESFDDFKPLHTRQVSVQVK